MFSIKFDGGRLTRWLADIGGQAPFVTAVALTKTAQDVRAAEVASMAQVFDRPTRFTLNALMVRPATKTDLHSEVDFKPGFGSIPAFRYLGPQVEGGGRAKKSHERALDRAGILRGDEYVVPGAGMSVDAQGNMRAGEITRILSQIGAAEHSAGYQANMTARSKRRNTRRAGGRYFVLRGADAPDGIYKRTGSRTIIPVMIFVRAPRYSKRLPFYGTAQRVANQSLVPRFREAWNKYGAKPRRAA